MTCRNFAVALAVLLSQTARADLAIRYTFELKLGPAIPAAAADAIEQQIAGMLPGEVSMRVKGDKCASSFGPLTSIIDGSKGEITLFNPATKQFATVPVAEYMERALTQQQVPAAAQQALQGVLQGMKVGVQMKKTGEVSTIQGIEAEDNLIVLSMEMPSPTGVPMSFRMEIHEWLASPSELNRIPALGELAGCSAAAGAGADPVAIIQKLLGQLPGASEKLGDVRKDLSGLKGRVALKTQVQVFSPAIMAMMATMAATQAQGRGASPAVDASAPLLEVVFNVAELSTDLLPDAVFKVPEGYQPAPLEDLLQGFTKTAQLQTPPPTRPATAAAIIEDFHGTAYRTGGGVSAPAPIYHPEPQYTAEARRAKIEGSVLLSLVIDENGAARNIKVVRSLDPGLDQSAIDAVRQWTFTSGQKDGSRLR